MKKTVSVVFMLLLLVMQSVALAESRIPEKSEGNPVNGQQLEQSLTAPEEDAAPQVFSEGVNTRCRVRFTPYEGPYRDMFLSEGDRIAVISPSSLPDRGQVDATVKGLRSWGYIPVEGKHVCDAVRSKEDCVADLRWALEDPSIKAVFCVRGGYGASEVMDGMVLRVPELIKSSRKLIIGYSDITVFHSAWTVAGLPSVHCSMSASFTDLPKKNADAERQILRGQIPAYICKNGPYYREGEAEGILIGGNLSTFTSVLNTAYDATARQVPYILFIEDVGEDLQHIHRYLTILKHFGVLDRASGIICGQWTDIPGIEDSDFNGNSRGGIYKSVADMITREFTQELDIPVAFGFPAGHGEVNYPLLMGGKVRLTVNPEQFRIEPAASR